VLPDEGCPYDYQCRVYGAEGNRSINEERGDLCFAFYMFLHTSLYGVQLKFQAPIHEAVNIKKMTNKVTCHLEAFFQSPDNQLRPLSSSSHTQPCT
jgi:hypothetical protein